jgi:serine/threonine-protein kinase RsbW
MDGRVTQEQIEFRATIQSNPRNISKVESFLKKVSKSIHLDEIQFHKLMVSMTEAVNNAIIHGNKSDPTKKVHLKCEHLPGWLLFIVEDQGKGFKVDHVANPLKKKNLMKESGRGIFLMRTLMDKVEFQQTAGGLEVRLWLALNK